MATTLFTAWYDDVMPHANGCPLPLALQKIREAAIAYCRLTHAWRYLELGPLDAFDGQQTYVIGPGAAVGLLPANVVVCHVFQVNFNDVALEALTPAAFKAQSDTWRTDKGTPTSFTLFNEGEISFWRIPSANAADVIKIPELALAPSQDATGVDSRIWEHGRKAIAMGALAEIFLTPGKPYTNPQLADHYSGRFNALAGTASARASSGRGHARLRTKTLTR